MTDPTKHSQTAEILNHLIKGGSITQLDALQKFECFRLASRIYDIRKMGFYPICKKVLTPSGKLVGEYRIEVFLFALKLIGEYQIEVFPFAFFTWAATCLPGDVCVNTKNWHRYKVLRTPKKEEILQPEKWLQRIETW